MTYQSTACSSTDPRVEQVRLVASGMRLVRTTGLNKNGRFVVFSVSAAKAAALDKGCGIDVIYTPETSKPSHSSIFGLPEPEDYEGKVRVATALARLVKRDDVYEAVVS